MFIFVSRPRDYRWFTGGKLKEASGIPRMQVLQKSVRKNGIVNTDTTWYLTMTVQGKTVFGAQDDSHIMLVKDYFTGHARMANFKLARIDILLGTVLGKEENKQPILSFLRQAKLYKEKFVDRNGPFDNIQEHFHRKGLLILLIEILKNLEFWNKPSVSKDLWQMTRMLICCNMIKEIQEKVFNLVNGTAAIHTWQTKIFDAVYDTMERLNFTTEIGHDTNNRDMMTDFTIETIPNGENEEGCDFFYCIFYTQFRFEYRSEINREGVSIFNIDMPEMEDPDLDEEHFFMLENKAMEKVKEDRKPFKLLLPNHIDFEINPILPAIEFCNLDGEDK